MTDTEELRLTLHWLGRLKESAEYSARQTKRAMDADALMVEILSAMPVEAVRPWQDRLREHFGLPVIRLCSDCRTADAGEPRWLDPLGQLCDLCADERVKKASSDTRTEEK